MENKTENTSKANIIRTAFALFLEKGYKEVTIKKIMEATGLSKGAIYHHFKSKETIYYAALDAYYFDLLLTDQLNDLPGNFIDDIEFLYKYVAGMFANVESLKEKGLEYPIRDFFSFQLQSEKNEYIRNKIYKAVVQYRNVISNLVTLGVKNGEVRSDIDIEVISMQIIGMIEGVAIHHSTQKDHIKAFIIDKYKQVFDGYFKMVCTSKALGNRVNTVE